MRSGSHGSSCSAYTDDRSDIVWNCAAEQVLQSLMKVYDIPLSKGAKVLALTIPECRLVDEDLDNTRDAINEGIMTCKRQNL